MFNAELGCIDICDVTVWETRANLSRWMLSALWYLWCAQLSVAIVVQISNDDLEFAMGAVAGRRLACVGVPVVAHLSNAIFMVYLIRSMNLLVACVGCDWRSANSRWQIWQQALRETGDVPAW